MEEERGKTVRNIWELGATEINKMYKGYTSNSTP